MEERQEYTKAEKNKAYLVISIIILLLIGAFIGIAFALKYNISCFTNNWFWFFLIGSVMPLIMFWNCAYAFIFATRSETEKKNCISNFYKYVGLIWIINAFYAISFSFDSIVVVILGALLLIGMIGTIITNFLGDSKIHKVFVPYDFVLTIGFTIYLIDIIDDEKLRSIVIPIVAAVYGGLITLTGVALTIKHEDRKRQEDNDKHAKERKEDLERIAKERQEELTRIANEQKEIELKKACPIFTDVRILSKCENDNDIIMTFDSDVIKGIVNLAKLKNSDNSNFFIRRLYFDGKWHNNISNNIMMKNEVVKLRFYTKNYADKYENAMVYLKVEDILGNMYYYNLVFYVFKDKKTDEMFNAIGGLRQISKELAPKE